MNKLTIETLKEIIGSYPEDSDEIECLMARQLLAYEQAAEHPAARITWDGSEFSVSNVSEDFLYGGTAVYLAPVLPKQPELIGMKVSIDTGSDNIGHRLFGEIVGTSDSNGVPVLCIEVAENNGDMAAPAQPVVPEQPEPTISFYRDGIIAAAKWVENQRDAYDNEHGQSDPETGSFEFGNNAQLEYSTTLPEIAEGIRSLHSVSAQPVSEPYKLAANDIIAERQRQISEEGWTPEHDDKYNDFQLALAAAGYAQNVADYAGEYCQPNSSIDWTDAPEPEAWPWSPVWWKPSNPRRDLVKAGALILAEIERLDRAAPAQESEQHG